MFDAELHSGGWTIQLNKLLLFFVPLIGIKDDHLQSVVNVLFFTAVKLPAALAVVELIPSYIAFPVQ